MTKPKGTRKYRSPKYIWVLFDEVNGSAGINDGGHSYVWWFYSRQSARDYLKQHNKIPNHAPLTGPFKYERRS